MTSIDDSTLHQDALIEVYQTPRIRLGTTLSHLNKGRLSPYETPGHSERNPVNGNNSLEVTHHRARPHYSKRWSDILSNECSIGAWYSQISGSEKKTTSPEQGYVAACRPSDPFVFLFWVQVKGTPSLELPFSVRSPSRRGDSGEIV